MQTGNGCVGGKPLRPVQVLPSRYDKSGIVYTRDIPFICYGCTCANKTAGRVGYGTVPLAILMYINGSFIKNKIAVKPIYITVLNLN